MGISTDGQICFGVAFPESFEFPWDVDPYDGDIEEWWLISVHGYERPFELYDKLGNYIDGVEPSEEKSDEYYNHYRKFKKSHPPVPIERVDYCSDSAAMEIIAISSTVLTCQRGYPVKFDPAKLTAPKEEIKILKKFLSDHITVVKEDWEYDEDFDTSLTPHWFLSSYYG